MRRRFRYDPDLEAVVEIRDNYFEERAQGPNVISDDLGVGVKGLRHMPSGKMLDSKSEHYRENRARGLEIVGNDQNFIGRKVATPPDEYMRATKDADAQLTSNWNGTRDRLNRENEQRRNQRG